MDDECNVMESFLDASTSFGPGTRDSFGQYYAQCDGVIFREMDLFLRN